MPVRRGEHDWQAARHTGISVLIHHPLTLTQAGSQEGVGLGIFDNPISDQEVGFFFDFSQRFTGERFAI